MIWSLFEVSQSNSRFNTLAKVTMTVQSVRIPVVFGRGSKGKGRPISLMAKFKTRVVGVKVTKICLAHAIIIAIAKAENYREYLA